jgi:hypothetical protein
VYVTSPSFMPTRVFSQEKRPSRANCWASPSVVTPKPRPSSPFSSLPK